MRAWARRDDNARNAGFVAMTALLVVAIVSFALACSSGSDSADGPLPAVAIQDDRLPVVPLEELPGRLDMIAATGAPVSRVDFFWGDVAPTEPTDASDPRDPAYQWLRTDETMRGFAARGIQPLVSVYDAPGWASGGDGSPQDSPINPNIPDAEAFGEFMQALATRYSGTFVPQGGTEPLPAIRHFEIWNEPNFSSFLGPQVAGNGTMPALEGYIEMVEAAYPAIKQANPDTIVIVGVGGPRGKSGSGATGARDWLRALREADVPLDAYSQHIYPAAAPDVETKAFPSWSSIDGFLEELDAWRPDMDLYITEAGYTTSPTPYRDVYVTDDQQAEYLTEIFELPQVRQERLATVVWFNLQDNAGWPAGLIREDDTKKPSYERFTDVSAEGDGKTLPAPADSDS